MSNLIARVKKALEFPEATIERRLCASKWDDNPIDFYLDGGKEEFLRTAKLVEALLEIAETVSVDFEEADRCTKILERALDEMEIK